MFDIRDALYTAYVAALLLLTMPLVWVVLLLLPRGATADRLVRRWSRFTVRASGCDVRVTGAERVHGAGAVALVSNHISYIDSVVLMAALPTGYRFVAEHGVLTWPMIGTAVRKAGHLTVDRRSRSARIACFAAMVATLRGGRALLVYPEGRRSRREGLLPFHLGAFRAAVAAGAAVVPIAIRGTDAVLAPGSGLLHRGPIDVTIYAPIPVAGVDRSEMVRLRDRARSQIASG